MSSLSDKLKRIQAENNFYYFSHLPVQTGSLTWEGPVNFSIHFYSNIKPTGHGQDGSPVLCKVSSNASISLLHLGPGPGLGIWGQGPRQRAHCPISLPGPSFPAYHLAPPGLQVEEGRNEGSCWPSTIVPGV